MEDENSNGLFQQNSFMGYGPKNSFNGSILSSKPPLMESIKNNFSKILGMKMAPAPKSGVINNNFNTMNVLKVEEPKSTEIKLDETPKKSTPIK